MSSDFTWNREIEPPPKRDTFPLRTSTCLIHEFSNFREIGHHKYVDLEKVKRNLLNYVISFVEGNHGREEFARKHFWDYDICGEMNANRQANGTNVAKSWTEGGSLSCKR